MVLIVAFCTAAAIALFALAGCALLWRRLSRLHTTEAHAGQLGAELGRTRAETSRFVAGVSHELRTPLTAIIGFTELLRDGRVGTVNRHQHEYLGIVRSSAGHLLTLIDEVLDTAGIQSGHVRLDPEPIAPAVIGQECVVPLRHLASERGIALDYRAPDAERALLDPARLRQVIVNLLSNAIKFTGAGGRVTLTVTRRQERLLITVTDTGIGIADEDRGRIFEPFVRLGGREREGSGLGLAVTRELVRAQGGGIGVQSRPGAGSTFSVWLPWVAVEGAAPHCEVAWQQAVAAMGLGQPGEAEATPQPFGSPDAPQERRRGERRFVPGGAPARPGGARRAPGAADGASRPASARAARP
jgi:signal transduction histidine kinase